MTERSSHRFEFTAKQIADAAAAEAAYHADRALHWKGREALALARVKETIGAKLIEREMTGGTQAEVVGDYGDPDAWREYQLARSKRITHTEAEERFRTDTRVYASQDQGRLYDLDTDDVHYFRLGGGERDE